MPVWGDAKIQQPAPQFSGTAVVDGEFREISLEEYKGKYVVLFFYPADLYVYIIYYFLLLIELMSVISWLPNIGDSNFIQHVRLPNGDNCLLR